MLCYGSFLYVFNFILPARKLFSQKEKEFENANEYLSAFAAHSTYWNNKDLCLFINERIKMSSGDQSEHSTDEVSFVQEKESLISSKRTKTMSDEIYVRSNGKVASSVQFWEELTSKSQTNK